MDTEPIAVGLQFGFLAVLYLFLLWISRSALKELRRTAAPAPEATGFHQVAGPGGRAPSTDAYLAVVKGGGLSPGERYDLFGGLAIGRDAKADVLIDDRFASGIHCRIYSRGPSYYVEDMGSTNGTFLNGGQLRGEAMLSDLDEIRIGDTEFRFEMDVPGGQLIVPVRIAEQSFQTDTGRQRAANEDSFFARAPLFAVADGMGGAQAGEVASRLAAEAFEPAERGSLPPEAFLRSIIESANRRINSVAHEDATRSGMGTTLTAALVEGDEISFGHVGDSRAYRLRDGELTLLTTDHSLVEELRRQGRLTAEQAEEHPQRSIITRALGPEPEVEVDTMTVTARPGDVYLLCSDGLTTMLKEERVRQILADADSLEEATNQLVAEANEAGGRDNITVIAFSLEEGEPAEVPDDATLVGPTAAAAGLSGEAIRAEAARVRRASMGGAASQPAARREGEPQRRRGRTALTALVAILLVAGVVAGAYVGSRQVYFLGSDEAGRMALYRGLPYELPLGIDLYSEVLSSPTRVTSLPEDRRDEVIDHELRSRDDAVDLLSNLEDEAVDLVPAQSGGQPSNEAAPKRRSRQTGGSSPNR